VVESDDSKNPRMKLKMTGNVIVDMDFATTHMRFARIKVGEKSTKSVDLLLKDPKSVKFGKPTCDVEGTTAKVVSKKDSKGNLAYALEVDFVAKKAGRMRGNLTLPIVGKDKKLNLTISAKVDGDISLSPERLSLWKNMPETMAKEVVIKSNKKKFKILKVEDSSGRMNTELVTVSKGSHYAVKVSLSDKGAKETKSFSAKVKVTTDSKEQSEIEFNVFYSPQQRKSSIRQGGVRKTPSAATLKKIEAKKNRKAAKRAK